MIKKPDPLSVNPALSVSTHYSSLITHHFIQGVTMKKTLILSLILLLTAGLFAERKALVIGNSNYQRKTLLAPFNDSNTMATALGASGFEVTQANNLTLKQFQAVVDTFAVRLNSEDEVIFYYSGHGAHGTGSNNYLLPIDADPGVTDFYDYPAISIHVNTLLDKLKAAKTSIVILEASRQWMRIDGARLNLGFVWEGAAENQMLVFSTGPDRIIPDYDLPASVFTSALAEKLNRSYVSANAIFTELTEELPKLTEGKYHPWFSGELKEDLLLYYPEQIYLTPGNAPSPSEVEGGGSLSW